MHPVPRPNFLQLARAMKLADAWGFEGLKGYIRTQMEAVVSQGDPIQCLETAKLYKIEGPLLAAATKLLCERDKPLSTSEASRIALPQAMAICHVREARLAHMAKQPCKTCNPAQPKPVLTSSLWKKGNKSMVSSAWASAPPRSPVPFDTAAAIARHSALSGQTPVDDTDIGALRFASGSPSRHPGHYQFDVGVVSVSGSLDLTFSSGI